MKKLNIVLIVFVLLFSLIGCKKTSNEYKYTIKKKEQTVTKVKINLSNGKSISLELYNDVAPITVENFLKLVDEDFYDGLCFHRIIANFMVQTGGYYLENSSLEQKTAKTIKGEFSANGIENNISHVPGVISMARATPYNSASSQFFICVADCTYLDGNYAAFGKTIDNESLKNVIELSKVQTYNYGGGFTDFPVDYIYIVSIERI